MRRAVVATRLASIAAVAVVSLASPALAKGPRGGGGTGGGGGTATVTLRVLNPGPDGLPHWNNRITFDLVTSEPKPYVNLKCYQGGQMVATSTEGFFQGALDDGIFGLSSPKWTGGGADCTADVKNPSGAILGSTSFHVYA